MNMVLIAKLIVALDICFSILLVAFNIEPEERKGVLMLMAILFVNVFAIVGGMLV